MTAIIITIGAVLLIGANAYMFYRMTRIHDAAKKQV